MPVTLTISDATASELRAALAEPNEVLPAEQQPPEQEAQPQIDITALTERIEFLEGRKIWHANSGNSSEKVVNIDISKTNPPYKVIYSVPLPDIKAGDLVEMFGQFEVTTPQAYNVMIGRQLILSSHPNTPTASIEVSEAAAANVTKDMHHMVVNDYGSYIAAQDLSGYHALCTAHIASDAALAGHTVRIEPDYGRLFVKVTPKSMLA